MKNWLLPSLCVAVLTLTLAGCSSYEPNIQTSKGPRARDKEQIFNEVIAAINENEKLIRGVHDAETAKNATDKVKEAFEHLTSVFIEIDNALKKETPEGRQAFEQSTRGRMDVAQAALERELTTLGQSKTVPPDFVKMVAAGGTKMKLDLDANLKQPLSPDEDLPAAPPDSSGWGVWLMCLLILGICAGFLSRDGIWSNAIRLVNVVFAGLLAMNFYEPLAKWITNYSADIHPYVSLFDFLAFWTCFAGFMAAFRAVTDAVSKVRLRFLKVVDLWGGVALSLCIGWIMVGLVLTSLHAAPLGQYPLLESFQPQNNMFFGMLAPDREWLGFTKYQSSGPFCRSVEGCSFPDDYIKKHLERRMHVEKYVTGNLEHKILVSPALMIKH